VRDDWPATLARARPPVVGLSSSYQQHLASLAMARRIKAASPETLVVLGGTNCNAPMGEETFRRFPFLDAVVTGPGEIAFVDLVRRHLAGERLILLPGVHFRPADGAAAIAPPAAVAPEPELDRLPMPAFDDFFAAWGSGAAGPPAIPIETSRGCWWGQKHHCVFCSENADSMRYRAKSPVRVFAEFAWMLEHHPGSRICATDEILDLRLLDTVMPRLAARTDTRRIFFSVKANLRKDQLVLLAAAGVTALQPGIESLCDEILGPMRKGVTGLQNIQLLKWCRELGIGTVWAILHGFPFEAPPSYARMAALVPSLTHLQPPKVTSVSLQRFSPLYTQAERFGIRGIVPHRSYRWIYRADEDGLSRLAYRFDHGSRPDAPVEDYVEPLRRAVGVWADAAGRSHLFYLDERACLLIGDTRPAARRRVHRLEGAARAVYLFCDRVQPRHAIGRALATAGHDLADTALAALLDALVAGRLMAEDKGRYLSLAVRVGRRYLPPVAIMAQMLAEGRAARAFEVADGADQRAAGA
jgi:ribosomal peptide maturation radical SAM protein 1